MKLLAFAATNSRQSINRRLVELAARSFKTNVQNDVQIEFLDLNDFEMPIYSIDREKENGVPSQAHTFFSRIGAADALLISFAEHNGFVTAAWKNLFDWMSRIDMKLWQGKPMVILAATPGPRAGAGVLQSQTMLAPHFGGEIRGSVGIGRWADAYDLERGELTRADDRLALSAALSELVSTDEKAGAFS